MSRSKKLTQKEIYFNRERKLNQMINKFARLTFRGNLKPDASIFTGSAKDFTLWTNTKNKDTLSNWD